MTVVDHIVNNGLTFRLKKKPITWVARHHHRFNLHIGTEGLQYLKILRKTQKYGARNVHLERMKTNLLIG